jgi:anti-sigma regulatory factor (Ser/Thr protein kinase)
VLTALVGQHPTADDIALVAMRLTPPSDGPLHLSIAAEPQMLVQLRRALRRWLREAGVSAQDENEVLVACGEACANVVQHAYEVAPGALELHASLVGQDLEVTVLDRGRWRPAAERGGGWGRSLMEAFMESVDVRSGPDGTAVTMRRKVIIGSGT